MFSKLVSWIKGLFSGTQNTGEVLTPEEAALAQRYGLQPSKANIAAFRAEVSQYQANGTLGPGVNNPDAVKQLQLALARLGYQAPASGQYDSATAQAVIRFKMDAGLRQTYRSADGNWAVNEYATPDVVAALIERLRRALGQ
ncbi:MAG: peptidoglycan-binding protein [Candidatus Sericytochromatia bacterium]|nr:peptidoglycan-binding protein [Candidatus Tanganyikabacteria bacterium]